MKDDSLCARGRSILAPTSDSSPACFVNFGPGQRTVTVNPLSGNRGYRLSREPGKFWTSMREFHRKRRFPR
jgi:hypothetical protein